MSYECDFRFRQDILMAAYNAIRSKNPVAYHKKAERKFGDIWAEVYAAYYERHMTACIAAVETMVDEAICQKHGWKTMEQMREESFAKLKLGMK